MYVFEALLENIYWLDIFDRKSHTVGQLRNHRIPHRNIELLTVYGSCMNRIMSSWFTWFEGDLLIFSLIIRNSYAFGSMRSRMMDRPCLSQQISLLLQQYLIVLDCGIYNISQALDSSAFCSSSKKSSM